jgi:hypothetical protein
MTTRIAILFLPSLIGLMWLDEPEISIVWSLAGSLFIAVIAQTRWFRLPGDDVPITYRLLHPSFMYHLFFVGNHVLGGAFYALNNAGYTFWTPVDPSEYGMTLNATAQGFMLLAHASTTAGMKLAGLRYDPPKYQIQYVPPYSLLIFSLVCLGLGNMLGSGPTLRNFSQKILQVASTAVLVEIAFAVAQRNIHNFLIALVLLLLNLLSQILSGWRGLALWTMITLCALLYPLMPRRVLFVGIAFALFWAFYLHPFGTALRPLIWYEQVDSKTAAMISMDVALNMSLRERLDNASKVMVGRANELYQFEKYLSYVPDVHPYFRLDLVQEALIGLVPRVAWPEKPNLERVAMQRVYDAGIVLEQADVSAKSNFYQDAYLSWGWAAVILVCLMLGFIIIIISHAAERLFGGYEIGTCLIFTGLFGDLIQNAPNFLFLVGSVCSSLVVMYGLFFLGRATGWIVPNRTSKSYAAESLGVTLDTVVPHRIVG